VRSICVGCQKVWCILLHSIVYTFSHPTHRCVVEDLSAYVSTVSECLIYPYILLCRVSESLISSCILLCRVSERFISSCILLCRVSKSLTYCTAQYHRSILTPYIPVGTIWVGCQKVWCILLHSIVHTFLHPTHRRVVEDLSAYVHRVSENLISSCILLCRVSESLPSCTA